MSRQEVDTSAGYERSDVTIKGVAYFIVGLAAVTAFLMALMVWMQASFENHKVAQEAAARPATRVAVEGLAHPPEPVIQGAPGSRFELADPVVEMEAHLESMHEILTTSAWVDRERRIVRIPIDHAKKLLLERGVPVRGENR